MKIFLKELSFGIFLLVLVFASSGCSLLQLPFTFLNQIMNIVSKLPTPPPGVFF